MQLSGHKILVTGGATGIGRGLAEKFLDEKNTVIVCGRRESPLKALAAQHPGLINRTCDLGRPEEREALFAWIAREHPDLDVLVNNAGIQNWMHVTDKDFFPRAQQEVAINIEAPVHLTALFLQLPSLKTILNVTSGLSFTPLSKVPVYSATKAFFHSFTLSLRHQLAPKGIEVIEIIPPALNTDLGGKGIHDGQPAVRDFIAAIFRQLMDGKNELTFGFSEQMTKAGPDQLRQTFARMNP